MFSRVLALHGASFSSEARVAIGTVLHVSFLLRKWTWDLDIATVFRISQLACYLAGRGLMSQEISFLLLFIIVTFGSVKIDFAWLHLQIVFLPVANDSDTDTPNHIRFWLEISVSRDFVEVSQVTLDQM